MTLVKFGAKNTVASTRAPNNNEPVKQSIIHVLQIVAANSINKPRAIF